MSALKCDNIKCPSWFECELACLPTAVNRDKYEWGYYRLPDGEDRCQSFLPIAWMAGEKCDGDSCKL